jgi:predicted anti-sigma-YlaC factor YlaD
MTFNLRTLFAMMGMMLGRPFGIRMVSCKQVVELLSSYFEGELTGAAKTSIDLHVTACPECKNFADSFQATGRMVGSLEYGEIPREFRQRLRETLTEHLREG